MFSGGVFGSGCPPTVYDGDCRCMVIPGVDWEFFD